MSASSSSTMRQWFITGSPIAAISLFRERGNPLCKSSFAAVLICSRYLACRSADSACWRALYLLRISPATSGYSASKYFAFLPTRLATLASDGDGSSCSVPPGSGTGLARSEGVSVRGAD